MLTFLLASGVAFAADDPPPPGEPKEVLVIQEGSEVLRRRAELFQKLDQVGYRKGVRRGEWQVFNSETPWEPRVLVHDDGWVELKRAPPRVHPPGRSFSDEGSPAEYLWCVLAPPFCVSVGGWVVGERKLQGARAEVLDGLRIEVDALNDAVARRELARRVNTEIPKDLERVWAHADVAPSERRRLLFVYWDTRTDTPEGEQAREAIRAFLIGVVQQSAEPFTAEELRGLNAARGAPSPLALPGLAP